MVAFYDRVLSPNEIQRNYNVGPILSRADTTRPTIANVTANNATTVQVLFSEPVSTVSAQAPDNYSINNGVTISDAVLGVDTRTVTLTTSTLAGGAYTLTVNNTTDRADPPNPIAPDSQATFNFIVATLTVTAGNQSRPYGAPNPVLTGTLQGVQNGDNITASYTTTADVGSPVGSYSIVPVLNDPDNKLGAYSVAINNGTLIVTLADLASALISSQNPSVQNSNVTFTVSLTPVSPATGTPTGSVQFRTNGMALGGPVPLDDAVASVDTALLAVGSNTVAAEYAGDGNFRGSTNSLEQFVTRPVQTPGIAGIRYNGNGTVTISFEGAPGAQHLVQATDELSPPMSWVNVSTNTADVGGNWAFTDSVGNRARRYYRAATR